MFNLPRTKSSKQRKTGSINKPCVHWMDCACLVHKICGYYNKGVYLQLIRSTTRRYFRGQQHGPAWRCIYLKNYPSKNPRNHRKLMKIISQLHERAINLRKDRIAICSCEEWRKGFTFCWRSNLRQSYYQSRHHKRYIFEGELLIKAVVDESGCTWCKRSHKSFDLSKIQTNSLNFWAKSWKSRQNPGKNGAQRCLTWTNGAQHLQKNTWRIFLKITSRKGLHDLCGIICVGKSRTKTFRASLGKNSSHPPKIAS